MPSTTTSIQFNNYLKDFSTLAGNNDPYQPEWLTEVSKNALDEFIRMGFPLQQPGNESWRYTNVMPIAEKAFAFNRNSSPSTPKISPHPEEYREFSIAFKDGLTEQQTNQTNSMKSSVPYISTFQEAFKHPTLTAVLKEHLTQYSEYRNNAFTSLNTAFIKEGVLIYVPKGITLPEPIELNFTFSNQMNGQHVQPRILTILGEASEATILQQFESTADAEYFCNIVNEVVLDGNSDLTLNTIQNHSSNAYHINTVNVSLNRDSRFRSNSADIGGQLVRNNIRVRLSKEYSSCSIRGTYVTNKTQHIDNQIEVDHISASTTSEELYKGVLADQSQAVFDGSIIVRKGACKTQSAQENKNLLLSDSAQANMKPTFWIYNDDVKCNHGAASGKLDQNEIFYMRSHGISELEAKAQLTQAYINEIIDPIKHDGTRNKIQKLVEKKLKTVLQESK
tara:strand:- start:3854 stop:5203 length:1350 start_codon:yes stop_codon:yes gene_type:complete